MSFLGVYKILCAVIQKLAVDQNTKLSKSFAAGNTISDPFKFVLRSTRSNWLMENSISEVNTQKLSLIALGNYFEYREEVHQKFTR